MIQGTITAEPEAVVELITSGPSGSEEEVEMVIDTGFNGFLPLPLTLISTLALPYRGRRQATLADGSQVILDVYKATVLWDGRPRDVMALAAEDTPVIGMSMLYGHLVTLEVVEGGRATIAPLP
jgi:clan AA aspartic protease